MASAPWLLERYGLVIHKTPVLVIVSLVGVAVVTAALSTLLVARRAAKLDPVIALRQQRT
jgi:ABC-type antimicrobial peptide transport system permease subunit